MKKISRFAAILVLATSFSAPLIVFAQACGPSNGGDYLCPPGLTCRIESGVGSGVGSCVSLSANPTSSTGGSVDTTYLRFYYDLVLTVVNSYFVPILIAVAFITVLWGAFKYFIWGAENEQEKADGRKFAMWGIIGFVIIMSVWGIVNIVKDTLIPTTAKSTHPTYPTL